MLIGIVPQFSGTEAKIGSLGTGFREPNPEQESGTAPLSLSLYLSLYLSITLSLSTVPKHGGKLLKGGNPELKNSRIVPYTDRKQTESNWGHLKRTDHVLAGWFAAALVIMCFLKRQSYEAAMRP